MKTTTYEATVENGQIKLPETVHFPDHTKVFVVVPDMKVEPFTIVTGEDGLRDPHHERDYHFTIGKRH